MTEPGAAERVLAESGGVDVLVTAAGAIVRRTAEETSDADWDAALALNLTATFRFCRAAIPVMRGRGGGAIVTVGLGLGPRRRPARGRLCRDEGGRRQPDPRARDRPRPRRHPRQLRLPGRHRHAAPPRRAGPARPGRGRRDRRLGRLPPARPRRRAGRDRRRDRLARVRRRRPRDRDDARRGRRRARGWARYLAQAVKIATWNVNSLRARLPRVLELLELHKPDVLLMQETKLDPGKFPKLDFDAAGYEAARPLGRALGGRRDRRRGTASRTSRPAFRASPTRPRRAGSRPTSPGSASPRSTCRTAARSAPTPSPPSSRFLDAMGPHVGTASTSSAAT